MFFWNRKRWKWWEWVRLFTGFPGFSKDSSTWSSPYSSSLSSFKQDPTRSSIFLIHPYYSFSSSRMQCQLLHSVFSLAVFSTKVKKKPKQTCMFLRTCDTVFTLDNTSREDFLICAVCDCTSDCSRFSL